MRLSLAALTIVLFGACSPGGDGQRSGVTLPDGARADCGTNPPQLDDLWIETPEVEADPPVVVIAAAVLDLDEDLHWYNMRVWWDDEPDGAVSTEEPYLEIYGRLSEEPCSVASTTLRMRITVTGGLPRGEEVEFGVLIEDDAGNQSDGGALAIVSTVTPD